MEPVLPDAPVEDSEFDLDVRLTAVARDVVERPTPPTPPTTPPCGTQAASGCC